MYAVVFLNNYWEWTGGMSQYMCWVTGEEYPDPLNPKFGYRALMLCSGRFYTNAEANALYRNYLRAIINRKNTINGRLYKDDPTIMAWQLGNEPRPNPEEQNREQHFQEFIQWVDETASYIKSLDPKHLVCTGNEGLAGSLWSEPCYKESHKSKNIDYMTFHLWVLNWQWYDPLKPEETYPEAEKKALNYLQQHIAFAQEIGKPVTLEEFGIPRDRHDYSPKAPTTYRDHYYTVLFDAMYRSAKSGSPMAGSNFWTWGGKGQARDLKTFVWQEGDDYTGDPPQEPQGRNSVFASDKSTLEIIRKYARLMKQLGGDH
jgi:mannan endo-1,4-beta-mannosidase